MKFSIFVFAAALAVTTSAQAKLFTVTWSGASVGDNASAKGLFDLNPDTPADPNDNENDLPADDMKLVSLTVTGASAGNGTFVASDFYSFVFSFYSKLDFSKELVGQVMNNGYAYGFNDNARGSSGDFNLFAKGGSAPFGYDYFGLQTDDGNGDWMRLTSIAPVVPAPGVPEPTTWTLMIGGLGMVGAAARRRHRRMNG